MEHVYDNEAPVSHADFEFSPENIERFKRIARQAMQPGLEVIPEGAATDYIDSLLPA